MNKKKLKAIRIIAILLVALNMAAIFYLSADDATQSNSKSDVFTNSLASEIFARFNILSSEQAKKIYSICVLIVRKTAHFAEYASLGLLMTVTCTSFYINRPRTYIIAQITGSLYAASDEIHQLFVPGRACQVRDVLIDSAGVMTGILFIFLILHIWSKAKSKKEMRIETEKAPE